MIKNQLFKATLIIGLSLMLSSFFPSYGQQAANNKSTVQKLLSKKQYEALFPHHDTLYKYEAFINAAEKFPLFANEGTELQNKRELAAFLANCAHETTAGGSDDPEEKYVWGMVYKIEQYCIKRPCPVYNTQGTSNYKPVKGKNYFGRGPLQLSYAYNYGLAGDDLHLPLLQQPELVCSNGIIAFTAALWFWMKQQTPKPSCHDVMSGKWQPTEMDLKLKRKSGFGMTINIINGGIECNTTAISFSNDRNERIGYYKYFCKQLGIAPEEDCDCKQMRDYK